MSRRIVAFMSLLVLGLAGCTTYGDGYYRDGYYSDGGYYYPAEDGYGDYYQGREYLDYRYYDDYSYSSYSPFWRLDRYYCGAFHGCSPYWNNYYRRPYSGWNISYGRGWGFGYSGWHGNYWSPWYGGYYDRRPPRRDRDRRPPVVDPDTGDGYDSGTDPDLRIGRPGPRPIGREPDVRRPGIGGVSRPPPPPASDTGFGPRPGNQGRPAPGRVRPGTGPRPRTDEAYVRPVPIRRAVDDNPGSRKVPVRSAPLPVGGRSAPMPTRADRSPTPPRFERRPAPAPQASRPAPPPVQRAPPPPVQRAPPPQVRPASQNRSQDDEQ